MSSKSSICFTPRELISFTRTFNHEYIDLAFSSSSCLKAIKHINENMISFVGNILCALMVLNDSLPQLFSIFIRINTIEHIISKRKQDYAFCGDIILLLLLTIIFYPFTHYSPNIQPRRLEIGLHQNLPSLEARAVEPWSGSKRIHPFPLRANSLGGEAYRSNELVNTNLPIELVFFVREVSPGSDTNLKRSGALA